MWTVNDKTDQPVQIEDPSRTSNEAISGIDKLGIEGEEPGESGESQQLDWLSLARQSYQWSTSYADTNYRKKWEDGIRAFQSLHSLDSKYLSPAYAKRSRIYRPKPRAIMRKNEAAAASAFFSNIDILDIQAENQTDRIERASADVNKALVDYRLRKSIKWFHVVLGGLQDAQKIGAVVARVSWNFQQSEQGVVGKDEPAIELLPIENFRIDPAADWTDPVGTSPYIIHLMPMYAVDVKERMTQNDPKTGRPKWKPVQESVLRNASKPPDSTAQQREGDSGTDPEGENRPIHDYSIVWVQRHIHKRDGRDWEFYTLGTEALLTTPQPLEISTWHGRDYVMGCCVLETHQPFPGSMYELGKQLFEETNEITNQRLDNVKLVLNKRWIVKRNRNVDVVSLSRNV